MRQTVGRTDFLPLPQELAKPQKHSVYAALPRFWYSFLRCGEQIILLFFIINHRDKIRKHLMELRQFTGRHVNALYAEALSV